MNTSSVHLRDLDNLVSAFSHMKDHPHDPRLSVLDAVSSDEKDKNDVFQRPLKYSCRTISPLRDQSVIDKIEHVTQASEESSLWASAANASNELHFGEHRFRGTASNQLSITSAILLESSSVIETDLYGTQHRKNSLHLISELCDRLATADPEKGQDSCPANYTPAATEAIFATAPMASTSQFIVHPNNQTDLSSAIPQNTPTCMQISAMEFSTTFEQSDYKNFSCTRMLAEPHNNLISTQNHLQTENSNGEIVAQYHEPFGTCCEPVGAVSHMEGMSEKLPPPLQSVTPIDAIYSPCQPEISQLLPDVNFAVSGSNTGRC